MSYVYNIQTTVARYYGIFEQNVTTTRRYASGYVYYIANAPCNSNKATPLAIGKIDLSKDPWNSVADGLVGWFDEKGVKEFFQNLEVKEQFDNDLDKLLKE